ncbi:MAG: hypothetical protein ACREFP_02295 [Acetobacteraceae bacterium]
MLILGLAGCAASQCDPNSAGFFTGIGCAVGGGYATRRQDLGSALMESQQSAAAAASQASANEAAAQQAEATLAGERTQLAAMEHEQSDLARRLAAAEAAHTSTSAQLDAAKRSLAALQTKTRAQAEASAPDPAALAALKADQQHLLDLMAHM